MGPHEWAVVVTEATIVTNHRITVSEGLIDELGIVDLDERRLVWESFEFLLEREPSTSIKKEFDLGEIADYFPEYIDEILVRMAR